MNIRHTLTTLALLSAAALAHAADTTTPATPRVDARQAAQDQRIDQGQASGTLTPRETRRLEAEQKGINKVEGAAKADGTVTAKERARLHRLQNKASRDIRRQKHDAQGVPADR
jgi:uncharacterized membrane protein YebE (DUF533 family)